jgi:GNAT superfamily N-acetyltransferase
VEDLLAADPVENTVALTTLAHLRAGRRWSESPVVLGWYDDGCVRAAVSMTPPHELLLAVVPDDTVDGLVTTLRGAGVPVPGVNGAVQTVEAFAAAWTTGTTLRADVVMRQRLYRLDRLDPPAPPPGRARPATAADEPLIVTWFDAFQAETGVPALPAAPIVRAAVEARRVWLWEVGIHPVAMAGRGPTTAGVARVGPVFTPPDQRGRGYGGAVTAACTADALRVDARDVVLFTDLANPASNAVYQRLGYRRSCDRAVVHFSVSPRA